MAAVVGLVEDADIDNPHAGISENPDTNDYWECHQGGKEAIEKACSDLYPDQPNPLITSACIKFWYEYKCYIHICRSVWIFYFKKIGEGGVFFVMCVSFNGIIVDYKL